MSLGYTSMFWALGEGNWKRCYELSSSSLLTLGTTRTHHTHVAVLSYSEATLGLLLLTLLISYLPTIYQSFSRREATVASRMSSELSSSSVSPLASAISTSFNCRAVEPLCDECASSAIIA